MGYVALTAIIEATKLVPTNLAKSMQFTGGRLPVHGKKTRLPDLQVNCSGLTDETRYQDSGLGVGEIQQWLCERNIHFIQWTYRSMLLSYFEIILTINKTCCKQCRFNSSAALCVSEYPTSTPVDELINYKQIKQTLFLSRQEKKAVEMHLRVFDRKFCPHLSQDNDRWPKRQKKAFGQLSISYLLNNHSLRNIVFWFAKVFCDGGYIWIEGFVCSEMNPKRLITRINT